MAGTTTTRAFGGLVALAMALIVAADTPGFAQAGRSRARQAQRRAIQRRIEARRPGAFAPGQAPAGVASPFAVPGATPFSGTANRQVRRYRGDNNEILGPVGPSGRNVGWSPMSPASGFTMDRVHEGYYIPGFGVNQGFAAPERVHGGYFVPGYGVIGGAIGFNGAAATQSVRGGTYRPGFGVTGPGAAAALGGPAVLGATPVGGSTGGFAAPGGSAVVGGSYVPGFGVTGGR